MTIIIIFITASFLFCGSLLSQPITWKKVYGTAAEENSRIVQQTFDGGYIVGYYNYFTRRSSLLKLNPYGQREWEKEINDTVAGSESINNIILSSDNGFIIFTNYGTIKSRIIKTDSLGNIQWTKNYRYEKYNTIPRRFMRLINGNYIIGGDMIGFNPPYSGNFLAYFDNEFNLLWQITYRDSTQNIFEDVLFYNNAFYIIGVTYNSSPVFSNLVKYDINGNFISKITYSIPWQSMRRFIEYNGLFYCVGDSGSSTVKLIFQVMDTNGTIHQKSRYNFSPAYAIAKTHDNMFALLSYAAYPISDAVLLKVDLTGNEIYRRFISAGDSTIDALHDIKLTSDNGFVMTGVTSYDIPRGDIANIFVVKTDSEGNSPPVRIEQIGINIPEDFILHQNYPNPFNPTTTVHFQIPGSGVIRMKLYDILGKEIAILLDKKLEAGNYSLNINFNNLQSNLSSGIYFIQTQYNNDLKTIKIIFNK